MENAQAADSGMSLSANGLLIITDCFDLGVESDVFAEVVAITARGSMTSRIIVCFKCRYQAGLYSVDPICH